LRAIISFCRVSVSTASSTGDASIVLDWESSAEGLGVDVEGVVPGAVCGCRPGVAGDIWGILDVDASNLGRNVELMSPIPTKKSSAGILTKTSTSKRREF